VLDTKWIRENPEDFDNALKNRGLAPASAEIIALDEERRSAIQSAQEMQNRRNGLAKQIGETKSKGGNADDLLQEASQLRDKLPLEEKLKAIMDVLPNIPSKDVPVGKSEEDNQEVHHWGEKPTFSFTPKQHYEIGEALGFMDFEASAKISGSRFVVLKSDLARLERALGAFMLDTHTQEYGYTEVWGRPAP
jgi:seryl-tRNA synthetase